MGVDYKKVACRDKPPEMFIYRKHSNEAMDLVRARAAAAKAVCARCSERTPCLEYAIDTNDRITIMGRMTPPQREHLIRARFAREIVSQVVLRESQELLPDEARQLYELDCIAALAWWRRHRLLSQREIQQLDALREIEARLTRRYLAAVCDSEPTVVSA